MMPQRGLAGEQEMLGEHSSAISACRRPRVSRQETIRGSPLRWQEVEVEERGARVIKTWVPCEIEEFVLTSVQEIVDEELHVDIYILIRIFKLMEY